jgi:leucyl aminopeptidase
VRGLAKKKKVVVVVPGSSTALVAAAAEGAALGAYGVPKAGANGDAVSSIALVGPADAAARKAVKRAAALGEAVAYTRDLVNQPPNILFPATFVASLEGRVKATKVKLKTFDLKQLRSGGFGGIVGVGQGSANEPRIAVVSYTPARPKATIALVGKGITFDSGGLCIKPAAGMLTMKSDMAGAAAVAATVLAVAELGLPVAVTAYLGLAENMPSSTAQRPSDVVTMRGGKTVEILNTDAEGRMVLGDCIALASETSPDAIVDVATLTGAQVVALANTAAVMGNDDAFRTRVVEAAAAAGEAMWPMPLPKELRPALDSINADLAHKGGTEGGMLTAGIFLSEFVGEGIPWSHIDIAGPSFNDKAPNGYEPKGGTGFAVRTLVSLIESYA